MIFIILFISIYLIYPQILLKIHVQGQFWNLQELSFPMHPLKSDFDHKLTEKLGVKVTKYHKESRLFQLIIKLEYTLRSF